MAIIATICYLEIGKVHTSISASLDLGCCATSWHLAVPPFLELGDDMSIDGEGRFTRRTRRRRHLVKAAGREQSRRRPLPRQYRRRPHSRWRSGAPLRPPPPPLRRARLPPSARPPSRLPVNSATLWGSLHDRRFSLSLSVSLYHPK
jgi:hypothetical protein